MDPPLRDLKSLQGKAFPTPSLPFSPETRSAAAMEGGELLSSQKNESWQRMKEDGQGNPFHLSRVVSFVEKGSINLG